MAEKSPDTILAEAVEQDVGERRACLALARCEDRQAVRKMQRKVGIRREHEKMLVPFLGGRRADRDLVGSRTACGNELAHPTQRFDGLGARVGTGNDGHVGRRIVGACDDLPGKPVRVRRSGFSPDETDRVRERRKKGTPDGCNLAELIDLDGAESRSRVGGLPNCGIAQIARRQYACWQVGANTAFDLRKLGKPSIAASDLRKIEISLPDLRERAGDRPCRAGKLADAFEFRQTAGIERRADGRAEILRLRRSAEATGQTCSQKRVA